MWYATSTSVVALYQKILCLYFCRSVIAVRLSSVLGRRTKTSKRRQQPVLSAKTEQSLRKSKVCHWSWSIFPTSDARSTRHCVCAGDIVTRENHRTERPVQLCQCDRSRFRWVEHRFNWSSQPRSDGEELHFDKTVATPRLGKAKKEAEHMEKPICNKLHLWNMIVSLEILGSIGVLHKRKANLVKTCGAGQCSCLSLFLALIEKGADGSDQAPPMSPRTIKLS